MKIVFKSNNWPYALLIKWATGGEYTHCGIVIDDIVYESKPFRGVVKSKYDPFHWKESVDIELSKEKREKIIKFLKSELGCGYDWFGVFHFIVPSFKPSKTRWFCSELIVEALNKIKFLKKKVISSNYSPIELYKMVTKNS